MIFEALQSGSAVRRTTFASLALAPALLLLAGCGPSTGTVSGSVLVDGQPLEKGFISFVPGDGGSGQPITVNIKGGKYSAQMTTGTKRVQISAPVVTGQRKEYIAPDAPLVDITEERLPPRYNSDTELTCDVKRGANSKELELSKPPSPDAMKLYDIAFDGFLVALFERW